MATKIELHEPFSYSLFILLILFLLVLAPILLYLVTRVVNYVKSKPKKEKNIDDKKVIRPVDVARYKQQYLSKIDNLESRMINEGLSYRQSYIELSAIVREFVTKATGIKASNFSLSEIRTISMPNLYMLIERFYEPEFGVEEEGTYMDDAFRDSRRIISEWN